MRRRWDDEVLYVVVKFEMEMSSRDGSVWMSEEVGVTCDKEGGGKLR